MAVTLDSPMKSSNAYSARPSSHVNRMAEIAVVLTTLTLALPCCAESVKGIATKITDGNTVTILGDTHIQYKACLAGISAPRQEPYARASQNHLAHLTLHKAVRMHWSHGARGECLPAKVFVNGVDLGLEQVKVGLGWYAKQHQSELNPQEQRRYAEAQTIARTQHMGRWAVQKSLPESARTKTQRVSRAHP
jgi:endonuclease YncB( thermonuclease family)